MANNTNIESFRWLDEIEKLLAQTAAERMGLKFHAFLRWAVIMASKRIMDEVAGDTLEDVAPGEDWK